MGANHPLRIIDLDQNSDAWLEWRHSGIGSSDAPSVLGVSPWKTRYDLWEEKVFRYHKKQPVLSGAQLARIAEKMREQEGRNESSKNRGKKLEPVAREEYEWWLGHKVPAVCGVHETYDFLKVSLDGWNGNLNLFAEIKCPNQKAHADALAGRVPEYYVPQLLHQFATSGGRACHYISYHDKYPPGQRLVVVPVDDKTAPKTLGTGAGLAESIEMITAALADFWTSVVEGKYRDLGD